jgi:predicted ATPase
VIRDCTVLAIDGTHSSGKTTLVAALVDHYARAGIDVVQVGDQARESPLIADVVDDPNGTFDLAAELDLLAATITAQLRAAIGHQLLVVDKTVSNVVSYAQILLDEPGRTVITSASRLCRAWQPYDLVVHCHDHFDIDLGQDPFRVKVTRLQTTAGEHIRSGLHEARYPVADLPTGLTTTQRVHWVTAQPALSHLRRP